MLIRSGDVYHSSVLEGIPGIVHGFSTRRLGDARREDTVRTIMKRIGEVGIPLPVRAEQIHGSTVTVVNEFVEGYVTGADGLVGHTEGVAFAVRVADCVPVLLADAKTGTYAAVHAGWKGTLAHIAAHAVRAMSDMGTKPKDIRAVIGPHIGRCCYSVPKERAEAFSREFTDGMVAIPSDGLWYLDLGLANYLELLRAGVGSEHIDAPVSCTSCQNDTFYSYRKDTKEHFGEIIGVIGRVRVA